MRIKRVLAAILSLLMLSSCAGGQVQEKVSVETTTEEVTSLLEDDVLPPEGTIGVFYADSYTELCGILTSDEFVSYSETPTLCITENFALEEPVDVNRAIDLIYMPAECDWVNPMNIGFVGDGQICVSTSTRKLFDDGCILIDAPHAKLEVEAGVLPDAATVDLYCNVAMYNGQSVADGFGGEGTVKIADAALTNSSSGKPYDGVSLLVCGNSAEVLIPLIANEKDVTAAEITFFDEGGAAVATKTLDLTKGNTVTVADESGKERTYMVTSSRLTYDVPLMEIHTEGGKAISSKTTYIKGTLTVGGESYPMQVRGRGNASWNQFPKKAYRIKLDDGASLFGLPQNRDWVLASNYSDKSLIRNCVAHDMAATLSGLEYTPTHIPVNLYINGSYMGVYTFADKIEDGKGRLDLGEKTVQQKGEVDIGFLLEIGWDYDSENIYNRDYFDTSMVLRIYVKEPEIEKANNPELLYVKKYIQNMEKAVVNNNGWEEYIDVDAWIDWLIINELTFNTESSFYRSCYLWKPEGGKLKLGPVWDFDMAFGNHQGDIRGYNGWCTTESTYTYITENWVDYLMEYPSFTNRLKERWNEVKVGLLDTAMSAVDRYSEMLDGSQQQNFLVWNIMHVQVGLGSVDPAVYDTYDKQVQYLRDFINTRWNYIDQRLNSM